MINAAETLPELEVRTRARSVWSPFYAKIALLESGANGGLHDFDKTERFSDIIRRLPKEADGFYLGASVAVEYCGQDGIVGTQETFHYDGHIYLPTDRARLIDMSVVERDFPILLIPMLEQGITAGVVVHDSCMAYNPEIIQFVQV